ncbi:PAS domain-containing protein [Pseudohalocynthiibacter aestuariivivens]|nr:PAS domain-containing protein [Pseudohalocynthiibacter aestuariivivens]
MAQAVRQARVPLCITDPALPDNPIVFANTAFCDLIGYALSEVVGRNCRFLQGPDTTQASIQAIRQMIDEGRVGTIEILNYRKDGSSFINALQIGPITDEAGKTVYFFGSQLDVTAKRNMEIQARKLADDEMLHRLRNIMNVMNVIIKMSTREESDANRLGAVISERLMTLSKVHFQTFDPTGTAGIGLGNMARTILSAYAPGGEQQFMLSGPEVELAVGLVSPLTLGLHELATNSVKYGALSAPRGSVDFSWTVHDDDRGRHVVCKWVEQGGPKVTRPKRWNGSRIVSDLIASTGGSIEFKWPETGLVVEADLPL